MLYPLSHALAPPCLLAARLSIISSHLIGHRLAHRLPALRHGWAGREAGSVRRPCLLGFALRSVPMSIGRFMLYLPAMSPRSACLSTRLRGGMAFSSRPCVMCCDVMLACPSSRSSPCPSSRRSGRFISSLPVFRHDGRGGGRMRCGCDGLSFIVLFSLRLSRPRACLPRVVPRHLSDTDGGGGLRSIGSAC